MDRQSKNWILCEERGSGIPLAPAVFVLYIVKILKKK